MKIVSPNTRSRRKPCSREALVRSAVESAEAAQSLGLPANRLVLSCKVSEVQELIALYRTLSRRTKAALHLGLTEAGIGSKGIVASTAALAVLLEECIGDTIRVFTHACSRRIAHGKK